MPSISVPPAYTDLIFLAKGANHVLSPPVPAGERHVIRCWNAAYGGLTIANLVLAFANVIVARQALSPLPTFDTYWVQNGLWVLNTGDQIGISLLEATESIDFCCSGSIFAT